MQPGQGAAGVSSGLPRGSTGWFVTASEGGVSVAGREFGLKHSKHTRLSPVGLGAFWVRAATCRYGGGRVAIAANRLFGALQKRITKTRARKLVRENSRNTKHFSCPQRF